MKNIYRIIIIFLLLGLTFSLYAADDTGAAGEAFGIEKVSEGLQNGGNDLVGTIDNILGYVIGLFYFIAIIFGVYAGFTILTGAGDEDKMKKGKNIFIYVLIGLVVIFLASSIIGWVITTLSDTEIVG